MCLRQILWTGKCRWQEMYTRYVLKLSFEYLHLSFIYKEKVKGIQRDNKRTRWTYCTNLRVSFWYDSYFGIWGKEWSIRIISRYLFWKLPTEVHIYWYQLNYYAFVVFQYTFVSVETKEDVITPVRKMARKLNVHVEKDTISTKQITCRVYASLILWSSTKR